MSEGQNQENIPPPEKGFAKEIDAWFSRKISRRDFLKLAGTTATATLIATGDQLLGGRIHKYVLKLLSEEQFRKKFWDSLKSGDFLKQDVPNLIKDITGGDVEKVDLGEKVNFSEEWFGQCFEETEIRASVENGKPSNRLLMVAKIANVQPVELETVPYGTSSLANFTKTQEKNGPFATLPSGQYAQSGFELKSPALPAVYKMADGKIVEFPGVTDTRGLIGGGLVVIGGKLIVANPEEFAQYRINQNGVIAKETAAFTISSERAANDLTRVDKSKSVSGIEHLSKVAKYDSFIVTGENQKGERESFIISTYESFNPDTGEMMSDHWNDAERLTISNGVALTQQLCAEKGLIKFRMFVPDPDFSSYIAGPEAFSQETIDSMLQLQITSQSGIESYSENGICRHRVIGYEEPIRWVEPPPVFLASKRT